MEAVEETTTSSEQEEDKKVAEEAEDVFPVFWGVQRTGNARTKR